MGENDFLFYMTWFPRFHNSALIDYFSAYKFEISHLFVSRALRKWATQNLFFLDVAFFLFPFFHPLLGRSYCALVRTGCMHFKVECFGSYPNNTTNCLIFAPRPLVKSIADMKA